LASFRKMRQERSSLGVFSSEVERCMRLTVDGHDVLYSEF
jgi:hypothetical protein